MPFLLENSIRHPSVITSYDPPIELRMRVRIALGNELSVDERARLPKRVEVGCGPTRKLTFIYAMSGGPYILPPEAHNILMELGAEGHVFHELEAVVDGVSLGQYFLQLQAPVIDCVDVDETRYSNGRGREYFEEVMARPRGPSDGPPRISLVSAKRISLLPSAITGRHWWRVSQQFGWSHFCSAELKQRFKEANIAGVEYAPCVLSARTA